MTALRQIQEEGDVTQEDLERMKAQLKDEEVEEDFFVSSDYKAPEIVSSEDEIGIWWWFW